MLFSELGLSAELLRALTEQQYSKPTPIQEQAIPVVLSGTDIMSVAQTGTGKTAAFSLPLLQRLQSGKPVRSNRVRALVLTPTRELAAQVHDNIRSYAKYLPMRTAVVFGGVKINPQMMALRRGVDALVATPGRLLDLHQQNALRFDDLEILVLDEADRMLDMGFIRDIRKIMALLPKRRQSMMFSATFSKEIRELAKGLLNSPVEINVAPNTSTAETVEHKLHPVDKSNKSKLLRHLILENNWHQVLVFSRTKHGANRLVGFLQKANISAAAIHGNKSQGQRTRALADFKAGKVQILVATDIAARGIDIDQLPLVINFDLPNVPEDYVHRIGRTGRANSEGQAISLVSADESKQLKDIERVIKKPIEREMIAGFEPTVSLDSPVSTAKKPQESRQRKPGNSQGQPRQRRSNPARKNTKQSQNNPS